MNLQNLSDQALVESAERTVASEREHTARVLEHLRELERRRLYAHIGYSSLYDYCTRALKYCPASAQLRIDAMRLTREVPEVTAALETGSVSLSSVGVLQKHIRMKRSQNGRELSGDEKRSLFEQIQNQSKDQAERTLAGVSPFAITQERVKVLTSDETAIRFVADAGLMELISEARTRLNKRGQPVAGMAEIFEYALKKALGHPVDQRKAASPDEAEPATLSGEVERIAA